MMEVFVARQPIFTKDKEIFGYELLYRNNQDNIFPEMNGEVATADVIVNSFINIGIKELSNGKPCLINFTEKLLNLNLPTYFDPSEMIVEILETVNIDETLIHICKGLKEKHYLIALDDFVLDIENPYTLQLLNYVDIIKVDFRQTSEAMRLMIGKAAQKYNIKLLAEKIETMDEFQWAAKAGYKYFQGYFFSKPIILTSKDIPQYFQNYLMIINHLSSDEPDLDFVTQLIEQDLSLSYKLLKLINSTEYHAINRINSIRQAIIRIGFNHLKKWIYILSLRGYVDNKSAWSKEIFINSLTRAKMCELIALNKGRHKESSTYFLTGMFSLMDTILGIEMDKILDLMPLQEDICDALKGQSNAMREVLDLIISIEKENWQDVQNHCQKIQIDQELALDYYYNAFHWANHLSSNE